MRSIRWRGGRPDWLETVVFERQDVLRKHRVVQVGGDGVGNVRGGEPGGERPLFFGTPTVGNRRNARP
jgi:hypothetical protein